MGAGVVGVATAEQSPPLRMSTTPQAVKEEWERLSVVQRVYGQHNTAVRKNIRNIQESMVRYQTGVAPDPSHEVPYENHPYDKKKKNRQLQTENVTEISNDKSSRFQPIRMHFETVALDQQRDREADNAAKIEWYVNEVLPRTANFWESALAVVPVSGKLKVSAFELDSRLYCGDRNFTQVPDEYISSGISDTDLILFVSGTPDRRFCQSRTLAVAVACNFDQFDRPTAGAINVCLDNIVLNDDGTSSDAVLQDYVDVTIHEVGHVLGHSSNSYRLFYDPDTGNPRTSRPFERRTVSCVDGVSRSEVLPGESTMQFGQRADGTRFASIVTPKVKTIAQNQFNCPTLEGAPLENQPTRTDSCTGDHWDERLFYPEAMSGVIAPTSNILSSLTLALMEDSGWYQANYTTSQMSPWGLGAGCEFVEEPCLLKSDTGGTPAIPDYSRGFFCNKDGEKACSAERSHKLACSVIDYAFLVGSTGPSENNQYFGSPTVGGSRQADYCPVYGTTYNNRKVEALSCRDANNAPATLNSYGEEYGVESDCLESSSGEGVCYRSACVQEDMTYRFRVAGKWYICEFDFQEHSITPLDGVLFAHTVTCPRLSQACPDLFCPFNCAGRGRCNYENEINGTKHPKCECFDPDDNSLGCSDSQIPDGGFLADGSGLFDNLEENFFDPLIAVFVDDPDLWTTASWAWAAGLLTICAILLLCICSSFWPQGGGRRKTSSRDRQPISPRPLAPRPRPVRRYDV
eukprot:scaffold2069_cov187-Amphora_coffeaeformis.AAC.37